MSERWKDVAAVDGYQVSNLGRVRSIDRFIESGGRWGGTVRKYLRGRNLRPSVDRDGYLMVQMGKGVFRKLHHLVLETFVGPRPPGMECAHLDGHRANNALSNLQWASKAVNESHKEAHGTRVRGECVYGSKLLSDDISRIRESALFGARAGDIAKAYGVSRASIYDVLAGRTWSHL